MKKLYIAVAFLAPIILCNSCLKETFPNNEATLQQIQGSAVGLESMVNGIPATMVTVDLLGELSGRGLQWDFALPALSIAIDQTTGDIAQQTMVYGDNFANWGQDIYMASEYAVNELPWDSLYKVLKSANDVIGAIMPGITTMTDDEYTTALESVPEANRPSLAGALAYRAYTYLYLVRLYEFKENNYTSAPDCLGLGVPVVTETTTEAEAKNNPRATVEDIYNKMIFPDLTKAAGILANYQNPDPYTVGLAFVDGMFARAYLERGSAGDDSAFPLAAQYARKAIDESGCTPLTQSQWEDPVNGFNNATSNNSWILGVGVSVQNSNLVHWTSLMSTEAEWGYARHNVYAINKTLYAQIPNTDFRKHSWLDPNRNSANAYQYQSARADFKDVFSGSDFDYAPIKFRPGAGNYTDYTVGGATDFELMRVEELYFIEAEATAHTSLSAGIQLLNTFMNTYRISDGSYDCTSKSADLDGFVKELMLQKRIEFWGEGIIMFDLKRLNMSPEDRGYTGTNALADYRLNCIGRAPYWNFAILRGEVQNNPGMGPNNPAPDGVRDELLWKE